MIVAVPLSAAVTRPDVPTVATDVLLLDQVTATTITCPFWSRTSAVNRVVSSRAASVAEAGLTVTVVATGAGGGGGGATAPSPQERSSIANPDRAIAGTLEPVLSRPGTVVPLPAPVRPPKAIFPDLSDRMLPILLALRV